MAGNRNDAGKAVDPGVVQAAVAGGKLGQIPTQAMIAQNRTPDTVPMRIWPVPRAGGAAVPTKEEATAAQPNKIPGVDGAWFGPLNPLSPNAPGDVRGRAIDMMTGWNVTTNNQRLGQLDVASLRALARNCDLINIAVDTRKDDLENGQFDFKLRDDVFGVASKKDPRIKELRDFFRFPDKRRPMARWIRKWADDLLVVDAPCVWIRRDRRGKPYEMRVIDTATIKPLLDADGETPLAPAPAFQQWLKGIPATNYAAANGEQPDFMATLDDMLWHPRNPRPDTIFGWSPVEQIILTVNQAIRRQLMILAGYTEGTIPEALAPVPEDWTLEQIAAFQVYWNELLAGKFGELRGVRFVPAGLDKAVFTKRWEDHAKFDEWLARIVMAAYRLPNTPYVESNNRATAGKNQEAAQDQGRVPYLGFICEFMNLLVWKGWGYTDIETVFRDKATSDELQGAQAINERLKNGFSTLNEERGAAGKDPYSDPAADAPHIITASGTAGIDVVPAPDLAEGDPTAGGKPSGPAAVISDVDPKKSATTQQLTDGDVKKIAEALADNLTAKKKVRIY